MDFSGDANHMFAIHNMVQCGMKYDKLPGTTIMMFCCCSGDDDAFLPGEWFGPSTAALVLR